VYRNIQGRRFEDVSAKAGPAITTPAAARGVAFGDFDNDGRLDAVVNNERRHGLRRSLYKKEAGMKRWVGLGVIADNLINIGTAMAK